MDFIAISKEDKNRLSLLLLFVLVMYIFPMFIKQFKKN